MTTSSSAAAHSGEREKEKPGEKTAEKPGDKPVEKMEKRRALGRGLESLLPGPRVVPTQSPRLAENARHGVASPIAAPGGAQQVPHRVSDSVRNDNVGDQVRTDSVGEQLRGSSGEAFDGVIRAVAEEAGPDAAELRSAGQPGAAVSTYSHPHAAVTSSSPPQSEGISIMAQAEGRVPGNLVLQLPLTDIDKNPFQTRYVHKDDALQELANSIQANGVVQPIVVRPAADEGRYILVLGERRLHASKLAGRETIPAIVRRVSEQQAAEMTIVENLQRQDLSALEQAEAFRVLSEEFQLTQSQIGERIGLSRESVANYMRLLRLPQSTMQLLAEGSISFAVAKELLKLDDKDQIAKAATQIAEKHMSFDQVERLVWQLMGIPSGDGQEKTRSGARWVDPNVRAAQTELERLLGLRVRIRDRKGKGKIVIEYATVDDYERVLEVLKGSK
jgi:ParB family transcriptional regulator, chromosome partitioning protein